MTSTEEALKLSIIYVTLLRDLEAVYNVEFKDMSQAVQLVADAAGQAFNVLSQQCPQCDMGALTCGVCGYTTKIKET